MNRPLCLALFFTSLAYGESPILQFKPDTEVQDGTMVEVPGVTGGTAKIIKLGFNPKTAVSETLPVQKVEILKEPSMDGAWFLRVTRDPAAQPCGIEITPATAANSLAALAPLGPDGIPRPSGAVDAFFRVNAFAKSGDLSLLDAGHHGGLRLVISSGQPLQGMVATLQALLPEKQIDTDLDGTPDSLQIFALSKDHPLLPDKIYHVAVTLVTDAGGVTTLKLYQQEGSGELRPDSSNLVAQAHGHLMGKFEIGFPETPIRLGLFGSGKKDYAATQDFAALRIYSSIPATFPALHD